MAIESCSSFLQRSGSATGAATPALFTNFLIKFGVKRASSSLRKVFDLTCKEVSNEKNVIYKALFWSAVSFILGNVAFLFIFVFGPLSATEEYEANQCNPYDNWPLTPGRSIAKASMVVCYVSARRPRQKEWT